MFIFNELYQKYTNEDHLNRLIYLPSENFEKINYSLIAKRNEHYNPISYQIYTEPPQIYLIKIKQMIEMIDFSNFKDCKQQLIEFMNKIGLV